jgi:hypothetical protein
MSLLIRNLDGRTLCLPFPEDVPLRVGDVKDALCDLEGIPACLQRLSLATTMLTDDSFELASWQTMPPLQVTLDLLGGKGGFGALLRATKSKAGQRKMTDNSACRDLNGRRLRHVDAEKEIAEWNEGQHKINHKQVQAQFSRIKKGKEFRRKEFFEIDTDEDKEQLWITFTYDKEVLEFFKAHVPEKERKFLAGPKKWIVNKDGAAGLAAVIEKYEWTFSESARLWIFGPNGPESMSRSRAKRKLANLKSGFTALDDEEQPDEEVMTGAVSLGLESFKQRQAEAREVAARKRKRGELQGSDDEEEEEEEDDGDDSGSDANVDYMFMPAKKTKQSSPDEEDEEEEDVISSIPSTSSFSSSSSSSSSSTSSTSPSSSSVASSSLASTSNPSASTTAPESTILLSLPPAPDSAPTSSTLSIVAAAAASSAAATAAAIANAAKLQNPEEPKVYGPIKLDGYEKASDLEVPLCTRVP